MKRLTTFAFAFTLLLALVIAIPAQAQLNTLTSTTLSAALAADSREVCLTSATGVVVPSTSAAGTLLFVDREPMQVQATRPGSTTCFQVIRAAKPIAHAASAPVYLGPRNYFNSVDPVTGHGGVCALTSLFVHPYVNLANGDVFACINSVWQRINAFSEGVTARATARFDAVTGTTGATLTNVTGLSVTVAPGKYRFYVNLPGVATSNSGIKAGFKYTSTTLTSIESIARIFTASAVAVQHSTTATDQASLAASTTAAIDTIIEGTMVVATGGTIQVQAAQNAAHADTTSVYAGASMTFTRIP